MRIEEGLISHPKIMKAAARLGPDGRARALAAFLASIAYAREHLTDGYVPDEFVLTCGVVQTPQAVFSVLSSRGIGLLRRVRGGYTIHDYHAYNKTAREVKEIRAGWAARKAKQRRSESGRFD